MNDVMSKVGDGWNVSEHKTDGNTILVATFLKYGRPRGKAASIGFPTGDVDRAKAAHKSLDALMKEYPEGKAG